MKIKQTFFIAVAAVLCIQLTACGAGTNGGGSADTSPQPSTTGSGVAVDENILTVDITLPGSFFTDVDMTTFDTDAYAKEQRFKKAVLNEDGSVTVTMTKARHREVLDEMAKSADDSYSKMVQSEDTPYITEIKHSDSFDTVDITVDSAGYDEAGLSAAFVPLTVYMPAAFYQSFAGVNIQCEINIVNAETGEIIDSVIYPDALQSQQ